MVCAVIKGQEKHINEEETLGIEYFVQGILAGDRENREGWIYFQDVVQWNICEWADYRILT